MFLFTIKHSIADVFLQTFHKNVRKQDYFNLKGHRHYAEHGACTLVILLFFVNPLIALLLSILDYLIHWHVDWGKTKFCSWAGIKRNTPLFWRIHTLDQMAHFSTYALIVWITYCLQ
jgi:hypothetical protein